MPQAILQVSPEWFTEILKSTERGATRRFDVIENGLPSDARVIEVYTLGPDYDSVIQIHLESATFPETAKGDELPLLEPPVFKVYYDDPVSSDEPQPF